MQVCNINKIIDLVDIADILGGLFKASIFGGLLTTNSGCYFLMLKKELHTTSGLVVEALALL